MVSGLNQSKYLTQINIMNTLLSLINIYAILLKIWAKLGILEQNFSNSNPKYRFANIEKI